MFELEEVGGLKPHASIKVVGVGGAGGNVVNNMIASNIRSVDFIAINTDAQVLDTSMATEKIQIGQSITRGLGAGSKPEIGRESALEDRQYIEASLEGADMVFITAGMGGGTGTGAAPVIAEIARGMGAVTVAVVTKPFFYEGGVRKRNADGGILELQDKVDTMIVIPNDRLAMVVEKGTPLLETFAIANDVLRHAVQGISDLVLIPGLINLDFADVKTIVEGAGRAVIGMGMGKGEGGAYNAAKQAVMNPLLENNSIDGAEGVLINITGGLSMSLNDVQEATAPVYEAARENANIMMGAVIDPDLKEEVRVTVIATRFEDSAVMAGPAGKPAKAAAARPETRPRRTEEPVIVKAVKEVRELEIEALCLEEEPVIHEPVVQKPVVREPVVHEAVVHEPEVHEAEVHEAEVVETGSLEEAVELEFPAFSEAVMQEFREMVSAVPKPHSQKPPVKKRPIGYKGAERVLSKSVSSLSTGSLLKDEDPLDVPTFLRKPACTRND